jgi:threonyl-tRNA synthetase
MPLWLAPVQAVVMNITERQSGYAEGVVAELKHAGLRAVIDLRNEKISYKIREHSLQKLPYQVIVGDQEVAAQKVAVRTRKGEDLGQMSLADFVSRLRAEEARLGRAAQD